MGGKCEPFKLPPGAPCYVDESCGTVNDVGYGGNPRPKCVGRFLQRPGVCVYDVQGLECGASKKDGGCPCKKNAQCDSGYCIGNWGCLHRRVYQQAAAEA